MGVIRGSHHGVPRDRSEVYDMTVKTLTNCLTSALSGMSVHTRMQLHSCEHTRAHKIPMTDCFTNAVLTDIYSHGYSSSLLL